MTIQDEGSQSWKGWLWRSDRNPKRRDLLPHDAVQSRSAALLGTKEVGETEEGEEEGRGWRHRFDPWVWKIPWRREWQPTPVFLLGQFHGQRSLGDYSPWGCKESDMTECVCTIHTDIRAEKALDSLQSSLWFCSQFYH